MVRGASLYYFARGLANRDLFGRGDMLRCALGQAMFRISGRERVRHLHAARDTLLAFLTGHDTHEFTTLCEEIYDETVSNRIWEGALRLAHGHLAAGQRVWLVTAAPAEFATTVARRLGFTGALGTVAETNGGVYTGRLADDLLHGPVKAQRVQELAAREELALNTCAAYSDSVHDLPMLSQVGFPHAVNPDEDLRSHARARGWPVHEFRPHRGKLRAALPAAGALAGALAVGALRNRASGGSDANGHPPTGG